MTLIEKIDYMLDMINYIYKYSKEATKMVNRQWINKD